MHALLVPPQSRYAWCVFKYTVRHVACKKKKSFVGLEGGVVELAGSGRCRGRLLMEALVVERCGDDLRARC